MQCSALFSTYFSKLLFLLFLCNDFCPFLKGLNRLYMATSQGLYNTINKDCI